VGQPSLGESPLVFSYKLMTGPDSEYLGFSCEFYESFPVFALSQRPVESLVGASKLAGIHVPPTHHTPLKNTVSPNTSQHINHLERLIVL
jgi:hypothetical protein